MLIVSLHLLNLVLQAYDQKNIRRRVYDALNVLMAMEIIYKDKKDIHWVGLPTNSVQEVQALQVFQKFNLVSALSRLLFFLCVTSVTSHLIVVKTCNCFGFIL